LLFGTCGDLFKIKKAFSRLIKQNLDHLRTSTYRGKLRVFGVL
jgi:hypothetical protein